MRQRDYLFFALCAFNGLSGATLTDIAPFMAICGWTCAALLYAINVLEKKHEDHKT
jgi:hypothetical protein